jgi:hypothetical protein
MKEFLLNFFSRQKGRRIAAPPHEESTSRYPPRPTLMVAKGP